MTTVVILLSDVVELKFPEKLPLFFSFKLCEDERVFFTSLSVVEFIVDSMK